MTELYALPGHLIRRLNQISVSVFAARVAEEGFDLTPVQFAALMILSENPGIDQATLAGLIAHFALVIDDSRHGLSRDTHPGGNINDRRSGTHP